MDLSRLQEIAAQKNAEVKERRNAYNQAEQNIQLQETIAKSFKYLVDYLDNRTSKTAVVNQLKEVGTPDALKVVESVEGLKQTLQETSNTQTSKLDNSTKQVSTSLNNLADVMTSLLNEVQQLPKENIKIPQPIDHTQDFDMLANKFNELIAVVRDNQKPPVVNVEKPDIPTIDTSEVAREVSRTAQEIKKLDKPQAEIDKGALKTKDVSNLIDEKYTRFRIIYEDMFDEDEEPQVEKIIYYNGNIKVATLEFSYKDGNLTGMKKT